MCARNGARSVTGLGLSPKSIQRAKQLPTAGLPGVGFAPADRSDQIPAPDESADIILCFDTLEHVMELQGDRQRMAQDSHSRRPCHDARSGRVPPGIAERSSQTSVSLLTAI